MSTWIQNKRKASGISQTEVAKSIGISRPTYVKLERGESRPTESQKAILSNLFNLSQETFEKNATERVVDAVDVRTREVPKENIEKFKQVLLYLVGRVGNGMTNLRGNG